MVLQVIIKNKKHIKPKNNYSKIKSKISKKNSKANNKMKTQLILFLEEEHYSIIYLYTYPYIYMYIGKRKMKKIQKVVA